MKPRIVKCGALGDWSRAEAGPVVLCGQARLGVRPSREVALCTTTPATRSTSSTSSSRPHGLLTASFATASSHATSTTRSTERSVSPTGRAAKLCVNWSNKHKMSTKILAPDRRSPRTARCRLFCASRAALRACRHRLDGVRPTDLCDCGAAAARNTRRRIDYFAASVKAGRIDGVNFLRLGPGRSAPWSR